MGNVPSVPGLFAVYSPVYSGLFRFIQEREGRGTHRVDGASEIKSTGARQCRRQVDLVMPPQKQIKGRK